MAMAPFSNGDPYAGYTEHNHEIPVTNGTLSHGYEAQLAAFRRSDEQRDALVHQLVRDVERLNFENQRLRDDYENEVESRRNWQLKATEEKRGHEIARNVMVRLSVRDGSGTLKV